MTVWMAREFAPRRTVRAWRERGELPLPDFAEESKIALDDTRPLPAGGLCRFLMERKRLEELVRTAPDSTDEYMVGRDGSSRHSRWCWGAV